MNIVVVGLGYVGLSNALLLAQTNKIIAYDISKDRVQKLQDGNSPIKEKEIIEFLENKELTIEFTHEYKDIDTESELFIVAVPTNYDEVTQEFDTSILEETLQNIFKLNSKAIVVIKSTIPIGFTEKMRVIYQTNRILFCPEFLREGKSLFDNLYPSRIIIGDDSNIGRKVGTIFLECTKEAPPLLYMSSSEAEAVKLFSNTYLAMRIAYFNELDTYSALRSLDTKRIIEGMSYDDRIGNIYNNPSFGFGGYCLPKDSKQLVHSFQGIPNKLISAIPQSNTVRKEFIVSEILKKCPKTVGIYKLSMKSGSDNFRKSSILDIMKELIEHGIKIIIFEPTINKDSYLNIEMQNDLDIFKNECDLIVSNRMDSDLENVKIKVYTRDVFGKD